MSVRPLLVVTIVAHCLFAGCGKDTSPAVPDKPASGSAAPAAPVAPPPPVVEDFTGEYLSNFGATVTFTQSGASVESTSKRHGKITCTATGLTLDCAWVNGKASGKEKLQKEPDGTLKGTYGDGESSTGGVISFKKRVAPAAGSADRPAKPASTTAKRACTFPDQTKCPSGNCENLEVSNGNCGRCGNFCPTGTVCQKGVCSR